MINTILFDLDGTLIDTNDLIMKSFIHTFKKHFPKIKLTNEELISFIGPTLAQTFGLYTNDAKQIEELISTYREYNIANHDKFMQTFPNVKETISYLYGKKYNLAICSVKKRSIIDMGLKAAGIDAYFKTIISYDDVLKHKPDPEVIHKALEHFPDVKEAIIVGDNVSDILAGRNAFIKTCAVNWSLKAIELRALNPDYYIYNIIDLIEVVKF